MNDALTTLLSRVTPEAANDIKARVRHYGSEFKRIEQGNDSPSIAFTQHGLVDAGLADMMATDPNAARISCQRGCGACCHLHVSIDRHEAALLAGLVHEGVTIDRTRLARQRTRDADTWNTLADGDRRCVFLSDGNECQVYEHRPTACRKYQVVSEPKWCDAVRFPGHRVKILIAPQAEIVSAAAQMTYATGSLAVELTAALEAKASPALA